jgi:hypothetical protein
MSSTDFYGEKGMDPNDFSFTILIRFVFRSLLITRDMQRNTFTMMMVLSNMATRLTTNEGALNYEVVQL